MLQMEPMKDYTEFRRILNPDERRNSPEHLWSEGRTHLLYEGKRVSVVGSRQVSDMGIERARRITQMLVKLDFTVVSGLAKGVDTVAHSTAIAKGGRTIAVLGSAIDQAATSINRALLEEIRSRHLVISQFRPGTPASKRTFPQRNRTMALISDATIIVEAQPNSGTIHQGWETIRLGRFLFILDNIFQNPENKWAYDMLKYGATRVYNIAELEDYLRSSLIDFVS